MSDGACVDLTQRFLRLHSDGAPPRHGLSCARLKPEPLTDYLFISRIFSFTALLQIRLPLCPPLLPPRLHSLLGRRGTKAPASLLIAASLVCTHLDQLVFLAVS